MAAVTHSLRATPRRPGNFFGGALLRRALPPIDRSINQLHREQTASAVLRVIMPPSQGGFTDSSGCAAGGHDAIKRSVNQLIDRSINQLHREQTD